MRLPLLDRTRPYGGMAIDGRLIDQRTITIGAPPARTFAPIRTIGGANGWYAGDAVWRLRGHLDTALGGPGPRRGRRDPLDLRVGDAVDSWRVEAFEPDTLLLLRSEMRIPGRAWLRYEVRPVPTGSELSQTAIFEPSGRAGRAYWYGIWPLHDVVFGRMVQAIADRVEASTGSRGARTAGG